MDLYAAALMLLAGALHASWHAVVKSGNSKVSLVGMGLVSAVLLSPIALFAEYPTSNQLYIIFIAVFFHVGYKLFLSINYDLGDFILVYPLSRGLIPLCAMPVAYLIAGQIPALDQVMGILIVSLGVICILDFRSFRKIELKIFGISLLSSLLVASYSVIDAYGARIGSGWLSFTVWLVLIESTSYAILSYILNKESMFNELYKEKSRILIAGTLGTISFIVFVWALSRQSIPSTIAFRECSVIFGVLISVFVLKEPAKTNKVCAACIISMGLFIIGIAK